MVVAAIPRGGATKQSASGINEVVTEVVTNLRGAVLVCIYIVYPLCALCQTPCGSKASPEDRRQ